MTGAVRAFALLFVALQAILAMALLVHAARADDALIEPTPAEYADIRTWIPQSCCWTQNCCKKVHASALIPLSRDDYRVAATGQVISRRDWSKDGQTWRCTCDFIDGLWVVSVTARTHCIFPAPQGY